MAKTLLVNIDTEQVAQILKILDDAGMKVSVALWLLSPDHDDWFLVLASRRLDAANIRDAYGLVHEALTAAGLPYETTPPLMILRMNDPVIRDLRKLYRNRRVVPGMRVGGRTIGDRFIEDAYAYRIS